MNRIRSRLGTFHMFKNNGVGIMRSPISVNAVDYGTLQCSGIFFLCALSDEYEGAYIYQPDGTPMELSKQNIAWSTNYECQ